MGVGGGVWEGDGVIKEMFMTGSRVYGKPREGSDWDIVIRCSKEEAQSVFGLPLQTKNPASGEEYPIEDGHQFKLGDVNLILCFSDARFESWRAGTKKLELIKPVSRSVAVSMFKSLFAEEKAASSGRVTA